MVRENPTEEPLPLSSEWIKRQRGKLTHAQFAARLGGKISKSMVWKWEEGSDSPNRDSCVLLLTDAGLLGGQRQGGALDSLRMTTLERKLILAFRGLPEDRQLEIWADIRKEADRHSQNGTAHEPKA